MGQLDPFAIAAVLGNLELGNDSWGGGAHAARTYELYVPSGTSSNGIMVFLHGAGMSSEVKSSYQVTNTVCCYVREHERHPTGVHERRRRSGRDGPSASAH